MGVWRTISGRKVFIDDGESITEAMIKSGKFGKTPEGSTINKKSAHAETRQKQRGISDKDITDALEHPIHTEKAKKNYIKDKKYVGKKATVIVSERTGEIITMYKTGKKARKKYGVK